jgi:hypothetical protein
MNDAGTGKNMVHDFSENELVFQPVELNPVTMPAPKKMGA